MVGPPCGDTCFGERGTPFGDTPFKRHTFFGKAHVTVRQCKGKAKRVSKTWPTVKCSKHV